ncbi:MAG: Zn-ribbon domain-containing protein [Nanoarchaeota archaeon]|nr:Zn-ribbon domain-containing protein [Nanoarchaeota archaeon]MBU4492845.1 Zn-ribbon domain-containing protein [Nanoarchaeota archaeon]
MPHQCVRCGKLYDDGAEEILKGCPCGGRLFFYISKKKLEETKNIVTDLTTKEKDEIEKDVFDLIGIERGVEKPVVLDLESIRILKPGKYELDIVNLFKKRPLIYKLEEGKYLIDLPESFKKKEE